MRRVATLGQDYEILDVRALRAAWRLTGAPVSIWLEEVVGRWAIIAYCADTGLAEVTDPAEALLLLPKHMRSAAMGGAGGQRAVRDCTNKRRRARTEFLDMTGNIKMTPQALAVVYLHHGHGGSLTTHGVCKLYPEETFTQ